MYMSGRLVTSVMFWVWTVEQSTGLCVDRDDFTSWVVVRGTESDASEETWTLSLARYRGKEH